jgi:hypothetical protein
MVNIVGNKLEKTLVGVAGEYFVAGELSRRGYIASITLRNTRGIDIIISNTDATKSISIQVKTNSDGGKSWILNKKSEDYYSNNHYYIFVALGKDNAPPSFHIVPSKIVAYSVRTGHASWLKTKKLDGSNRKDSSMRKFDDHLNVYFEKWNYVTDYFNHNQNE